MPHYVYVLANLEGETYVGQTSDLDRRLQQHNHPAPNGTLHTKRRPGPWRLVYSEQCPSRAAAMKREKQLKSSGGRRFIRSLLKQGGC